MPGKYRLIAVILTVFTCMFSAFSYADTEPAAAAGVPAEMPAAGEQPQKISKSSYMCFIGTSAALATGSGIRSFEAKCFKPSIARQIKKARSESLQKQPPETGPVQVDNVWPDPSKPMVALTFDDGPYGPVTDRILERLEANGGHATFFVVGNRVKTYASSVQRAVKDGCQIGNHTYEHKNLTKLSSVEIQRQMHDTDVAVACYAGSAPVVARPVGGAVNDTVKASVGKPLINWSIDTLDWKSKNAASVQSKVLDHVQDGDIILMHDLYKSTADACDVIIPELVKRGFQLVTVSELAEAKGVTLKSGELYRYIRTQSAS